MATADVNPAQKLKVFPVVLNSGIETFKEGLVDPCTQFLLTVIADLGRLESENLSYRVKSGQKKARKAGVRMDRPSGEKPLEQTKGYKQVRRLLKQSYSVRQIAAIAAVSPNAVSKVKNP